GSLPSNTVANPKGKLKSITTRSGLVTDGPTVPTPPKSITPEVGERVEEIYTDPDLADGHPEKVTRKTYRPGKFLIPCSFSELKCKALADLGASINLMPLSVWKELGLPELIPNSMTLELANRAICTPAGIARDVFVPVGKFTFPADFVIVDYESDPRVPLILGRPFLRTARALVDVHGEEMILRDDDERLTLNMKHDTSSYSNHPQGESVNLINTFNVLSEDFLEVSVSNKPSGNPTFSLHQELTSPEVNHDIHDSEGCNDIHPHFDDDPLSGSTTYSANSLLEEFTNELALITYSPDNDDNLQFDIESDLKEIEFLLYQGTDSSLKDSIDQTDLANLDDYFVDPTPEMFTDEHAPDYSSPLIFDVYDDNFLEVESDADNVYDDHVDSKGEKIKEVDVLPSTNNEDKVFNPGILIHEKPIKIITRVAQEKKLAISNASLVLEDFDPPFCEPPVFKDVPKSKMLLPFSSENEEKVFKPGIYIAEKVLLLQEFDFKVLDTKGAENLAADHLSQFENPYENMLDPKEINETFPLETLSMVTFRGDSSAPWFADFENYHAGNFIVKGVCMAKKLLTFSKLATKDPRGDIMVLTSPPRRSLMPVSFGPPSTRMPTSLSKTVTRANDKEKFHNMPQNSNQICEIFDVWAIDFMGPFPSSQRNQYILMAVDYLSKWVEAKALPTNDARVVCKFLKSLFVRFGAPRAIISDRDTHFCNDQFTKVMLKYRVTHRLSTAYHPQTSGRVEVSNRGLKRILKRTIGENRASWSDKLDDALWAFHTAYKTPIGCTPYKLAYGKAFHLQIKIEHKAYWP
nr:reverse transcriptase domain-containing protein [Tanacetum cinerariifolium]GEY40633.1 reverse transcriptase domain-containing protein [Tanacetum cinerariifolium]